jgi:hypothetical protein
VVCVLDSQEPQLEANIEIMDNLDFYLRSLGYDPSEIPRVIQYNKQDLPGSLPPERLRDVLNPDGLQDYSAVAIEGQGVLETMVAITRLMLDKLGVPANTSVFEDWLLKPPAPRIDTRPDRSSEPGPMATLSRRDGWLARLRHTVTSLLAYARSSSSGRSL